MESMVGVAMGTDSGLMEPRDFGRVFSASELACSLKESFNWFSGVPDSDLAPVINRLPVWHFAVRENHAVGMAFGATLAGRKAAVLMQNSGLGLSLDAIAGTFLLYELPLLLLISNRGNLEREEPQHKHWGKVATGLLEVFEIPVFSLNLLGQNAFGDAIDEAQGHNRVVAVMAERGNIRDD